MMLPASRLYPLIHVPGAQFYRCLTARADVLFEVADALLCTDGPVRSLVDLVLVSMDRSGPTWPSPSNLSTTEPGRA